MRQISAFAGLLLAVAGPVAAQEPKYSIREVGFVEAENPPYRLILLARDLTEPAVKKQEAALRAGIADSNIVLVAQKADANTIAPDKQPLGDLATPRFWLIAPDERVIPFQPGQPIADLVQSPLRQKILQAATTALCAVVLLEGKDEDANGAARIKAEAVLTQIKHVRKHLPGAPAADLQLLTLSVADRPRERWTLWGLGEEVTATDMPKIAVIFGRMRRAGPLFEGIEWPDDALFGRIAALGQACEDELDRKEYFGTPLPFQWPKEWSAQLIENLHFDPQDAEIRKVMTSLLTRPLAAAQDRQPRKMRPADFDADPEPIEPPMVDPTPRREEKPMIFNDFTFALILLLIGVAGWMALGTAVYLLDRSKLAAR